MNRPVIANNPFVEKYLKQLRVIYPQTLFELTYKDLEHALIQAKCPLCGNQLKEMRRAPRMYCNGKKHAKSYSISIDKFMGFYYRQLKTKTE